MTACPIRSARSRWSRTMSRPSSAVGLVTSMRPNILVVMVDQLAGTFFPDGPADFLHVPNLKALAARSVRFGNCYTASPLCAPARAAFMSGLLPSRSRRLRQCRRVRLRHPDLRASSARRRLPHLSIRKDALRRPRPAARLRGAADHRHLSRRLRLDARLPQARRAHRLVVSHAWLGGRRRRRRDDQPARVRRRGRLPCLAKALRAFAAVAERSAARGA